MEAAAERYADQLDGKVVVDISNPVNVETFDGLLTPADSSAAEELAEKLSSGAKVVKAFNTTFAGTLVEGEVGGQPLDVFIAGDDDGAKGTVAQPVRAGGLNAIDAGHCAALASSSAWDSCTWRSRTRWEPDTAAP